MEQCTSNKIFGTDWACTNDEMQRSAWGPFWEACFEEIQQLGYTPRASVRIATRCVLHESGHALGAEKVPRRIRFNLFSDEDEDGEKVLTPSCIVEFDDGYDTSENWERTIRGPLSNGQFLSEIDVEELCQLGARESLEL